jgi:hypothetical protein
MAEKPTPEAQAEQQHAELAEVLKRAEQGDLSVLPQLQKALDADARIWQHYGNLAIQAEAALVKLAALPNLVMAESLARKLHHLKKELGGDSPSPLERLLVERVTATWLEVNYFSGLIPQVVSAGEARAKLVQRHLDAAHRRHETAMKTLATVRKLLRPAPSPLQLLKMPVEETPGKPAGRSRQSNPAEGLAVVN